MKAICKSEVEIDKVEASNGLVVTEMKDKLIIEGEHYEVILTPRSIDIEYTIHRPDHDHDNYPQIRLEIPEGGVVESFDENRPATLHVIGHRGHLMLDMYYRLWLSDTPQPLVPLQTNKSEWKYLIEQKEVKECESSSVE